METDWEGLGVLLGKAVSKMQFCIVKLTNGPIKLLLVTEHSSEAPPKLPYLFQTTPS
jgi:hypothetical protein